MWRPLVRSVLSAGLLWVSAGGVHSQVIEFESGGYRYQALTRNGLTIMFTVLPSHVREYAILQVSVQNGSKLPHTVRPEDFIFQSATGIEIVATPARQVVSQLAEKGGRGDVVKLVTAYESTLYGNNKFKSTNGYEQRRQSALAEVSSARIKAAAAASAIALVATKLMPGDSTDGAVFYANEGKPLGAGTLRVRAAGGVFEFPVVSSN